MKATAKKIDNDGRQWYELNGTDSGTGYIFRAAVYAVTDDNKILNCDGYPMTEGDNQTIAVRNTIES